MRIVFLCALLFFPACATVENLPPPNLLPSPKLSVDIIRIVLDIPLLYKRTCAATGIRQGVAATAAHCVIGGGIKVQGVDLSLHCADWAKRSPSQTPPVAGAAVTMYGFKSNKRMQIETGTIYSVNVRYELGTRRINVEGEREPNAILIKIQAMEKAYGFSGGPVVDNVSGSLVAITTSTISYKNDPKIPDGVYLVAVPVQPLPVLDCALGN